MAVKTIHRQFLTEEGAATWLERFRHEARAAGSRFHANIVATLEYGEDDGAPYIAMEYVEGRTLHSLLKEAGRLDLPRAIARSRSRISASPAWKPRP